MHSLHSQQEVTSDYKLRVEDRLAIAIYGDPSSSRLVTVDVSGCISFLFINALPVQGKTIGETRAALENRLRERYKNPLVSITLSSYSGPCYSILGEVKQPGKYRIQGAGTVLDAVAEAAGISTQADLQRSFLLRNQVFFPLDLVRLIARGDMSQNAILEEDDCIYIAPPHLGKVYILGEVRRPACIQYLYTLSLAEALAESGGLGHAAGPYVVVLRGSLCAPTQYLIDIHRILKGQTYDFTLEPGDIVYIPSFHFCTLEEITKIAVQTYVNTISSTYKIMEQIKN